MRDGLTVELERGYGRMRESFRLGPRLARPMAARKHASMPAQETAAGADACDVCGGPTYDRNCKVICTRCGYTRDCSDP